MNPVSEKWATALLEVADADDKLNTLKDEITDITPYFDSDFLRLLKSRKITKDTKKSIVREAFKSTDRLLQNFICLLIDMDRIANVKMIFKDFVRLANMRLGITEIVIISARPLAQDSLKRLSQALIKKVNGPIAIEERIDESLISGIKVIMGAKVIDVSMQRKIADMRKTLLESW